MKTAIISGGSRGIGQALVTRLSQEGWRIAFSYHQSEDAAKALAEQTGALAIRANFEEESQVDAFVRRGLAWLGHLDAMVFNAGVAYQGLLSQMSAMDWDRLMAINLKGAFLAARPAIDHMVERKQGSLLFVSSIWGQRGASCEAAYAASKAGLIALSTSLAQELGPSGIRVNSLAPGLIKSDMLSGFSLDEMEELKNRTLLGRVGRAEEVAAAAHFLLSEQASYITGQTLTIDGGFL